MSHKTLRAMLLAALFAALTAVGAFIRVPIGPTSITLQFFFSALAGILLGVKWGVFSQVLYVGLGLLGFPIFTMGGGLSYLLKPTFGFLMGFAAAGYLTGRIHELHRQNSFGWLLFSAVWGLLADYACGMVWFYVCSNYVLQAAVSWKLVFINCFLLLGSQ